MFAVETLHAYAHTGQRLLLLLHIEASAEWCWRACISLLACFLLPLTSLFHSAWRCTCSVKGRGTYN
jgi:hypothetical protein